jgi:predicted DNA-binding protein with PD1-like motif
MRGEAPGAGTMSSCLRLRRLAASCRFPLWEVAIQGQFDRIVTLRFKFGTDLLAGLEKMVAQQKIKNAVILAGAGSVRGYQLHQVSNRDMPLKNMFETDPTAPADMVSMNG